MGNINYFFNHSHEAWEYLVSNPVILSSLIVICLLLIAVICWAIHEFFGSFFHKWYWVKKAAKELGISKAAVQTRFDKVLEQAKQNCKDWGVDMRFTFYLPGQKRNSLGMATLNKKLHTICYAPLWIYLVVAKSKSWETAFMHSVGHEFGHSFDPKKGKNFMFRSKEERRFYNWICEVHSDFEGISFMKRFYPTYSRKTVLNAVEKKAEFYDKAKKPGKYATMTHPSWKLRVALMKNHEQYSEEIIKEVARAAGCTNQDYILEMHSTLLPF